MAIKTRKIGIIGAGNVGSHLALQFAVQGPVSYTHLTLPTT